MKGRLWRKSYLKESGFENVQFLYKKDLTDKSPDLNFSRNNFARESFFTIKYSMGKFFFITHLCYFLEFPLRSVRVVQNVISSAFSMEIETSRRVNGTLD